jgi:hypothetical protein
METIQEYVISPWEQRIPAIIDPDGERAAGMANRTSGICIATSSSERKGMVGMGGAIYDTHSRMPNGQPITFSVTLGPRSEQNPYIAELEAMAMAIQGVPPYLLRREITIITSNQAAIQVVNQPKRQSGQASVIQIYDAVRELREGYNRVLLMWAPAQQEFHLGKEAKRAARRATEAGRLPQKQFCNAKSTIVNRAAAQRQKDKTLPEGVGKHLKKIDTALPGRHTRTLYDALGRREANILVQLRTGMARLNGYLHHIGAVESDRCACGQARETVEHFLFNCPLWETHRECFLKQTETRRGSLSYFLGGKAPSDPRRWTPTIETVQTTIKYAIATGRLDRKVEQRATQTSQQ